MNINLFFWTKIGFNKTLALTNLTKFGSHYKYPIRMLMGEDIERGWEREVTGRAGAGCKRKDVVQKSNPFRILNC